MPEEQKAIEEHQPHAKADYVLDGTQSLLHSNILKNVGMLFKMNLLFFAGGEV